MGRVINIKELKKHYLMHNLTDFLTTLSDEELEYILASIYADDVIDEKIDIVDAIRNEIEYRKSDIILKKRTR